MTHIRTVKYYLMLMLTEWLFGCTSWFTGILYTVLVNIFIYFSLMSNRMSYSLYTTLPSTTLFVSLLTPTCIMHEFYPSSINWRNGSMMKAFFTIISGIFRFFIPVLQNIWLLLFLGLHLVLLRLFWNASNAP